MADPTRTPLDVASTSLSIGAHSVGFPPSRTGEQVVEAYIELIRLIRAIGPEDIRTDDFATLADVTGLERSFIQNRVTSQLSTRSS